MARKPEIGNVQLYPDRPLTDSDRNGYVLKFYCPLQRQRIRKNTGTRDRREARRVQRECRERLLNGLYVQSSGAISKDHERATCPPVVVDETLQSWDAARERYRQNRSVRVREGSLDDALSRIDLAERVFRQSLRKQPHEELLVTECLTLDRLEFLQEQLLAGAEGRGERRSPNTVNSMVAAVMAFTRFCHKYGWIPTVPAVQKLEVEEVMKGRPVTSEEFERMLAVTPQVVGPGSAPSWQFAMQVIWETGFRIGDLMNFHWHDERHIHPVWSKRTGTLPTLVIPSSQKNGRVQEIPLLPGLAQVLESVPNKDRLDWVVDPLPLEFEIKAASKWIRPDAMALAQLTARYTNRAIARACGVSDTSVRKWLTTAGIERTEPLNGQGAGRLKGDFPPDEVVKLRSKFQPRTTFTGQRKSHRMTVERVSRVIALIGQTANILVRREDDRTGSHTKYASAHDLRRGFAHRLINFGVTAETLKLLLRHADFATTQNYYGATRSAQAAGLEVRDKLTLAELNVNRAPTEHPGSSANSQLTTTGDSIGDAARCKNSPLVGGLMGGPEPPPTLTPEEAIKLKALLARL